MELGMSDQETLDLLAKDPGNTIFAEYADSLRESGDYDAAVLVCLRGLSVNYNFQRGRLVLSRVFYEMNCIPFAIEQVKILVSSLPENKVLRRLLKKLTGGQGNVDVDSKPASADDTVAEADFDFDEIDLLEEEK